MGLKSSELPWSDSKMKMDLMRNSAQPDKPDGRYLEVICLGAS